MPASTSAIASAARGGQRSEFAGFERRVIRRGDGDGAPVTTIGVAPTGSSPASRADVVCEGDGPQHCREADGSAGAIGVRGIQRARQIDAARIYTFQWKIKLQWALTTDKECKQLSNNNEGILSIYAPRMSKKNLKDIEGLT